MPRATTWMFTSSDSGIFLVWTARIPSRPSTSGRLTTSGGRSGPGAAARLEHVRTVGGSDEDDAFVRLEAVDLDEQLVQRLLALVVAAAEAGAATTADRVDLVDEDVRRRPSCPVRTSRDARRADANEHPDEVGGAIKKNGTLASPATARANNVFPVPGGPMRRTPLGCGDRASGTSAAPSGTRRFPAAPLRFITSETSLNVTFP